MVGCVHNWESRSEQQLTVQVFSTSGTDTEGDRIIETTISQNFQRSFPEYIVILRDITERKQAEVVLLQSEALLREQAKDLQQALKKLQQTQAKLIHTEKMSSLGQLVAGIAHEINNPVTFVHGNISHVSNYSQDLLALINLYQQHYPTLLPEIQKRIEEIDLEFMREDLPKMLASMKVGTQRIGEIVLTLRNFSRLDEANMKFVNIHEGIDSTLLILQHRSRKQLRILQLKSLRNMATYRK